MSTKTIVINDVTFRFMQGGPERVTIVVEDMRPTADAGTHITLPMTKEQCSTLADALKWLAERFVRGS